MRRGFEFLVVIVAFAGLVGSGCGIKSELYDSFEKTESIMFSMEEDSENEGSENKTEGALKKKSEKNQIFNVVPYDMRFTFSDDWEDATGDSPYDLQMKRDDRYYCSIFGFKDIDLPNGMVPEDVFELQKEDLLGNRDFVELIREEPAWEDENKKIYRELYSGEFEGGKYYYYCCLIDFKEPAEGLAWVVFSGIPSWIENDMEEIDQILMTAEDVGDSMDDESVSYTKKNNDAWNEYHQKLPYFYAENGHSMEDKELDKLIYRYLVEQTA